MRRSLSPILLISLGLVLVVLFFLFGQVPDALAPDDSTPHQDAEPTGAPLALSSDHSATSGNNGLATPEQQTPQPVIPTPTDPATNATASDEPSSPPPPGQEIRPEPRRCPSPDCLSRAGVSGRLEDIVAAAGAGLPFGNYFDWWLNSEPPLMAGRPAEDQPRYWQMVPVGQDGVRSSWSTIEEVSTAQPGAVWIVGNEPDVAWQDNTTPKAYAAIYHDVYEFIKERDPTAKIAIGGVAQPSPLRFTYLEQVLDTYQDMYGEPMPVDIWTVHAFILREQAGSWGVGIPPGLDESEGLLYEIADHDDLEIFQDSLVGFRQWMSDWGYGAAPLAVTEFGILHPADYGFPPQAVIDFMIGASDFMSTATGDTGDPDDDYRLVQYWFWYSAYDDGDFPTGNLYDAQQQSLTAVGRAYSRYLGGQ